MESKTFFGRIAVGDDSPLEVALRVTSDQLQVVAGAVDIGTWPIADCDIRANGSGDFAVYVDGDAIHFTPDDHGDFAEMVASIDRGTPSGFLSGRTGLEGSEVAPNPAPQRRAAKSEQTPAGSAEVDVAESGLADTEAASEVTIEGSQVEEVAERAPKHKRNRPAPKGNPRAPKRIVMHDPDQTDGVVEVDEGPSGADDIQIDAGPEPAASGAFVPDSIVPDSIVPDSIVPDSIVPDHAGRTRFDVGGGWEIDPDPEPEPWSLQREEPVVEFPVVDESAPEPDVVLVADDPGPAETALDPGDKPGLVEPAGTSEYGAGVSTQDRPTPSADAVASPESLTERVMAIGEEGEELRRNFGQRLGRRRMAPSPPVTAPGEDNGAPSELTSEAQSLDEDIGTDAGPLAAAVEALRRQSDNEEETVTVADAILASQRSLRESSTKPSRLPSFLRRLAILTGVVLLLGGFGLGGYLAIRMLTQDAELTGTTSAQAAPTSPVATPASPTTEAVSETTIARFQPTAFALTAPEFVKRWNETAASVNPQLALPSLLPGEFEFQLTRYVAVAGTVGGSGSVDTMTMTIDPTGPSEADAIGLQAMGLMILVADPNLDGPGRRDLLASMGLDVSKPVLTGLDSATSRGGVDYRLFYDGTAQRLFFTAAAG